MTGRQRWVRGLRPITDEERPYMAALGRELKALRTASGMTWPEMAASAVISKPHLSAIAYARSRTRRSTLARVVAVAVEANPDLGSVPVILDRLCEIGGPSLVWDTEGEPEPLEPPTEAEVRRLFGAWQRSVAAAARARKRYEGMDARYHRLTGEYAYVGHERNHDD